MKYYFITGTSQGLGYALTTSLLEENNNFVIGISRKNKIEHPNYKHVFLDLSDLEKLKATLKEIFTPFEKPEKITLINNAGILGQVGHVGKINHEDLEEVFTVNTIAPAILTNQFIREYLNYEDCHKLIVNVSSGAGKKPTDGWSGYCASKAALDMFSEVVAVEKQKDHNNLKVLSIAPGIVDTPMQNQIRHLDKVDFSRVDEFIEYKKENMLVSPAKVAAKFLYIMENESKFHDPVLSVRDV